MTTFVLDLNDAQLRVGRGTDVVAQSSGYALIEGNRLLLGDDARRAFRLHPRQAHNAFWHRLSTEVLSHRTRELASHADLVYRHLRALVEQAHISPGDELIIAAAATTSAEQLALLLGIAEQVGLNVTGLVDAAVAATATAEMPALFRYIDVGLHRLSVTQVQGGNELERVGWQDITELSLAALLDAWVNVVADRFVRETRFDPLVNAATEQQVYDRIFDWFTSGAPAGDLGITIEHAGTERRIDLSTALLTEKAVSRYRVIDKALDGVPIVLSHRAAALPGFEATLHERTGTIIVCKPDAVFQGVAGHLGAIRSTGDGVRFVTRLPSSGIRPSLEAPRKTAPTHILCGSIARPIGAGLTIDALHFPDLPSDFPTGSFAVRPGDEAASLSVAAGTAVAVDGAPGRDGVALATGAVIEVAGVRFTLIEVADGA